MVTVGSHRLVHGTTGNQNSRTSRDFECVLIEAAELPTQLDAFGFDHLHRFQAFPATKRNQFSFKRLYRVQQAFLPFRQ